MMPLLVYVEPSHDFNTSRILSNELFFRSSMFRQKYLSKTILHLKQNVLYFRFRTISYHIISYHIISQLEFDVSDCIALSHDAWNCLTTMQQRIGFFSTIRLHHVEHIICTIFFELLLSRFCHTTFYYSMLLCN